MKEEDINNLKMRNEIFVKRCERYRAIMYEMGLDGNKISEYFYDGKLTINDARYLFNFCEIEVKDLHLSKLKPPLGVISRDIWDRKRQEELSEAMSRYLKDGKKIPKEWLDEYNEISDRWE